MSDKTDHLEHVEFASNAASVGEDVGAHEMANAVADKDGLVFAFSDEFIFSHMEEKCASPLQRPPSDALQNSEDEDESEDEATDELLAFFENLHITAGASGAATPAALYTPTPDEPDTTTTTTTAATAPTNLLTSFILAREKPRKTTGSSSIFKPSPVLEIYLSRTERHELLIMGVK